MKYHSSIHSLLGAAFLFSLGACGDDGQTSATESTGSTSNPGTTTGSTGSTGTTPGSTTIDEPTTGSPTTGSPTTGDPTTGDPTTGTSTTTGGDEGFVFRPDPFDAYTQIDRHGAVEAGTAGILASAGLGFGGEDLSLRDAYNASNPADDVAEMWLGNIAESIMFFHAELDPELEMLGFEVASFDDTVAQAGPVIIPDTIKYDPTKPTAYPNGRALTDPVVDITLAAVLLKLGPNQPLSTFADIPLNPPANDVPFLDEFPFLAPPHL